MTWGFDYIARKLYWSAIIVFSLLYVYGVRVFPVESVLISIFISAAATPLSVFLGSFLPSSLGSGERGVYALEFVFSLWALGMLIALVNTLDLFTFDLPSVAVTLALSAVGFATKRHEPDFSPILDSFAVSSLYLLIQQSPSYIKTTGDENAAFFYLLSLFFMGASMAYKLRAMARLPFVLALLTIPVSALYALNSYPSLASPISVLFLAAVELIKD